MCVCVLAGSQLASVRGRLVLIRLLTVWPQSQNSTRLVTDISSRELRSRSTVQFSQYPYLNLERVELNVRQKIIMNIVLIVFRDYESKSLVNTVCGPAISRTCYLAFSTPEFCFLSHSSS